jgi:hypothetical protein
MSEIVVGTELMRRNVRDKIYTNQDKLASHHYLGRDWKALNADGSRDGQWKYYANLDST